MYESTVDFFGRPGLIWGLCEIYGFHVYIVLLNSFSQNSCKSRCVFAVCPNDGFLFPSMLGFQFVAIRVIPRAYRANYDLASLQDTI